MIGPLVFGAPEWGEPQRRTPRSTPTFSPPRTPRRDADASNDDPDTDAPLAEQQSAPRAPADGGRTTVPPADAPRARSARTPAVEPSDDEQRRPRSPLDGGRIPSPNTPEET